LQCLASRNELGHAAGALGQSLVTLGESFKAVTDAQLAGAHAIGGSGHKASGGGGGMVVAVVFGGLGGRDKGGGQRGGAQKQFTTVHKDSGWGNGDSAGIIRQRLAEVLSRHPLFFIKRFPLFSRHGLE
jgi:hypothetical protein